MAGAAEMADLGIVQCPADVLTTPTVAFELPAEADEAHALRRRLEIVLTEVIAAHGSRNGMGIAAPQIDIGRSLAIVRPREGDDICLVNPRVVASSAQMDVRFEGCLSFFDVRGKVRRPRRIDVVSNGFDGREQRHQFVDDVARLVCHEIDHLRGKLYTEQLEEPVIDLDAYARVKDSCWQY